MKRIHCLTFILHFYSLLPSPADASDEYLRPCDPSPCFLFSWGKGPNQLESLSHEFRLALLETKQPSIDSSIFDSPEAFQWIEKITEPRIVELARVDGAKVIKITYQREGVLPGKPSTVLVAKETGESTGWFRPFFAAMPELFTGKIVSGPDLKIAYIATLEFSGTGALRTHQVFDLTKSHPVFVYQVRAGRLRSIDFGTDEEYQKALKVYKHEEDIHRGILPPTQEE